MHTSRPAVGSDDASDQHYTLPNGALIVHQNKGETDFVYQEIFDEGCYLKHGITVREGDCIFDVGANIGLFSLYLSRLPFSVNVFAFEPLPPIYRLLETNRCLCRMEDVRTFQYGLSSVASMARFTYYPRNSIMSGRYADAAEDSRVVKTFLAHRMPLAHPTARSEALLDSIAKHSLEAAHFDCALRTVSDVIAEHEIRCVDLLKVDVEKSELDVLRGIADQDWPKIRQLAVEVYDGDGRLGDVQQLLRHHGYLVNVEQDECLQGSPVYMVYATCKADG